MGQGQGQGRTERRKDAEGRQKEYESLTPQQKLDKLPGQSETPSNTQKRKSDKPSRKERWEEKNKE